MKLVLERLYQYILLVRLNKPIGILLLLWPTLWALLIAGQGRPNLKIVFIFFLGTIIMRSAGCVINDIADRHIDRHVQRTRQRPLAAGKISLSEAFVVFLVLLLCAIGLVLLLNQLTMLLSILASVLAIFYPFTKRFIQLPQLFLGLAFAMSVPMAFTALLNKLTLVGVWVFVIAVLWPFIYDTFYAMADREDDLRIGVKSTAVLFGKKDKLIISILQTVFLLLLIGLGLWLRFSLWYFLSLLIVIGLIVYQHYLIRCRDAKRCFLAFLNNNWIGGVIFIGILLNY